MPGLRFDRHVAWCSGTLILACDLGDALGLVLFRNVSPLGCQFVRVSFGARFRALCLEPACGCTAVYFVVVLYRWFLLLWVKGLCFAACCRVWADRY